MVGEWDSIVLLRPRKTPVRPGTFSYKRNKAKKSCFGSLFFLSVNDVIKKLDTSLNLP